MASETGKDNSEMLSIVDDLLQQIEKLSLDLSVGKRKRNLNDEEFTAEGKAQEGGFMGESKIREAELVAAHMSLAAHMHETIDLAEDRQETPISELHTGYRLAEESKIREAELVAARIRYRHEEDRTKIHELEHVAEKMSLVAKTHEAIDPAEDRQAQTSAISELHTGSRLAEESKIREAELVAARIRYRHEEARKIHELEHLVAQISLAAQMHETCDLAGKQQAQETAISELQTRYRLAEESNICEAELVAPRTSYRLAEELKLLAARILNRHEEESSKVHETEQVAAHMSLSAPMVEGQQAQGTATMELHTPYLSLPRKKVKSVKRSS